MNHYKNICLCVCLILLASCSGKTSKEITADLWAGWEKAEVQMQEDFPEAIPIILVHGWNGGEFTWPEPDQLIEMEKQMQRDIYLFTYRTGIFANRYPPLEVLEEQLDRYLEAHATVDVIAHSMGGLLVRHYLSHHANSSIRRVVFLATPHFGTNAAQVLVKLGSLGAEGNIQATEIQPGSDFLWQLNSLAGSELDSVQALNVYLKNTSLLQGDFVVDEVSAYLPWAFNATVEGRHHEMAKQLMDMDMVTDFVQNGILPEQEAAAPARKDVWLRLRVRGELAMLSENNFHAYSARGLPNNNFDLCCKLRSGLYARAGLNTVVIEDIEPGSAYKFTAREGYAVTTVFADDLLKLPHPVIMKYVDIDPIAESVPAASVPQAGLPQEAMPQESGGQGAMPQGGAEPEPADSEIQPAQIP